MGFKKAVKEGAKLRLAIFGPSGSGKTFTALRIATGIGGRIGVMDSERRTARKYADRFTFDVMELDDRTVSGYIAAVQEADREKIDVLVIDSASHAWQELLEDVDKLAAAKFRGNTFAAWSEGTPKQHAFIDALLEFSGHLIVTMRSKTEWQTASVNGKATPVRVGLAPQQGKGIEYEFDLLMELSTEHVGNIIKDRTSRYQDALIEKPGEDFGRDLAAWLADGAPPAERPRRVERAQAPAAPPVARF